MNAYDLPWETNESFERFASYWEQVQLINETKPNSILNVGKGLGFLKKYYSDSWIKFRDLDINPELKPDYLKSINDISGLNEQFDTVCAFQVLEHLPITQFGLCLNNLALLSKNYILLSLPINTLYFRLAIDFPLFHFNKTKNVEAMWKHTPINPYHNWEIGAGSNSFAIINDEIKRKFVIVKQFQSEKNKYHYFYMLKKKD